jgi:hypothetical protein
MNGEISFPACKDGMEGIDKCWRNTVVKFLIRRQMKAISSCDHERLY